jgi:hypothetical protein
MIRLGALAFALIVSGCDVGGYFAEPLTGGEYCSPYWEGYWSTEKSEDDGIFDGDQTGIRVAVGQPTSCNDATFSAEICIKFVGQPPLCIPASGQAEFVRSNGRVYANVRVTEVRGVPVTDRGLDLVEIRAASDSRLEAAFAQSRVLKALIEKGQLDGIALDRAPGFRVASGGEELARVLARRPEVFTEHTFTFLKE